MSNYPFGIIPHEERIFYLDNNTNGKRTGPFKMEHITDGEFMGETLRYLTVGKRWIIHYCPETKINFVKAINHIFRELKWERQKKEGIVGEYATKEYFNKFKGGTIADLEFEYILKVVGYNSTLKNIIKNKLCNEKEINEFKNVIAKLS